jgi:hypothetical protein
MCCRASRSFADLVGTDLPGGSYRDRHGHHRLLIRTLTVAPANGAIGQHCRFPSSDERRLRRILPVPTCSDEGRLTERAPVVLPRRRQRVKVPHTCRSHTLTDRLACPKVSPSIQSAVCVASANRRLDFPRPEIVQARASRGLEATKGRDTQRP